MATEAISEFEARRVQRMLRELWPGLLSPDETLTVTGELEAGWMQVQWELANADRTMVYAVQTRAELKPQRLRQAEAVALLYDFLGAQFDDFFRTGREPFTGPKWEAVQFAGKQIFTRGQVVREAVEADATALLDADAVARSRRGA